MTSGEDRLPHSAARSFSLPPLPALSFFLQNRQSLPDRYPITGVGRGSPRLPGIGPAAVKHRVGGFHTPAVRDFCHHPPITAGGTTVDLWGRSERPEVQSMHRSLFRITAYLQLALAAFMSTGCVGTLTQPYFLNESPDLEYYLNTATRIEYPDVEVDSLAETTESLPPLTIGNHDYEFWNLTLEECVSIALNNARFFVTTSGNVAAQFTSASADQLGSIYDVAITQSTTQSIPLTIDGAGNRTLPRGVLRANQIGGVEDALAEFDAQASAFFDYSTTDRPQNTTVNVATQTGTTTQQSAISKRFATGGVGTLRQQIIYDRTGTPLNQTLRVLPSTWTASLEAQVQHPLMRNRGTLINRIPVVLASLNEDVALADFEIQVRNLVRDVEVAYWDLYVAYRAVSTAIIARNSAQATYRFAQLQFEGGTGAITEVAQAQEQYFNFRASLEAALAGSNVLGDERFGVYGAERVLRELMGVAPTDGRLVRPIDEPSLARVEFDWHESVAQMLYLSPEMRRGRYIIKQRELEQMTAKNQLLPEVNLSLLYRWVGVGATLGPPNGGDARFPGRGSSALGELTSGDFQEGVVRLEITPPAIGGRRERTRIRGAQLRLQQSRAYLQDAERLLVSQLSGAVAKAYSHYQLVQSHAQRWQAAETEVTARLAEYRGGQSPVNVVLQSQQRRADAQIDYYRSLAEYNKSINYVDYLKGTMLANSNITLAEGPWNKKAYWDALERARERSAGKKGQYGVSRPGVVRRGPVCDAESAAVMGQDGAGEVIGDGVIIESPADGSIWYDEPIEAQPIDVNDIPLQQMGDSPSDMFLPAPQAEPMPAPNSVPDSIPTPTPDPLPDESGLGTGFSSPPIHNTIPTGYQTATPTDGAPQPVARKPLPGTP